MFSTIQLAKICNCPSEKMLGKYKSLKEFNRHKEGSGQIGADLAQQIIKEENSPLIK